jgi:hypothetical protein
MIHLAAAQQLCDKGLHDTQSMTLFKRMIIGEFIFQLSIASTFHPSVFRSNSMLDVHNLLLAVGVDSTSFRGQESSPNDLAVDILESPVFDWIFRLSYLRLQVPLSGENLVAARGVLAYLHTWQPPTCQSFAQKSTDATPHEVVIMVELYRVAGIILAHKILSPSVEPQDVVIQPHVCRGTKLVGAIPESGLRNTTVLIWPMFILGLAAGTVEQRQPVDRALQYLWSVCGVGCAKNIQDLLEYARLPDGTSDGRILGLGVLFRDDLLSQIIF